MKLYLLLFMVICFMLPSCKTSKPTPNNLENISIDSSVDSAKIRFDGIYNTYDTTLSPYGERTCDILVTNKWIVFLNSNKIHRSSYTAKDSVAFRPEYCDDKDSTSIGQYKIKHDSVFAYIPTVLYKYSSMMRTCNANYSGYIKNKDTILDWRMVPPFPDVDPKSNDYFIYHTTPRMLYFIKNDAVRCLDSIAGQ